MTLAFSTSGSFMSGAARSYLIVPFDLILPELIVR